MRREIVAVLRVIKAAQRLGFTLDDIAELLEVGRTGGDPVTAAFVSDPRPGRASLHNL